MDVVYVVGPHRENEELRFSLRSIATHLVHGRVWIAGYAPRWVSSEVGRIRTRQAIGSKFQNSVGNTRAACAHPDVSDPFLYFNDDFFVLEPTRAEEIPPLHRGPLSAFLKRRIPGRPGVSSYATGRAETAALLDRLGIEDPLAYEPIHSPLPVGKAGMLAALEAGRELRVLHYRTLYGNLAGIGGELGPNVKIPDLRAVPAPGQRFASSSPLSFKRGKLGALLRARFPDPCRYEV